MPGWRSPEQTFPHRLPSAGPVCFELCLRVGLDHILLSESVKASVALRKEGKALTQCLLNFRLIIQI